MSERQKARAGREPKRTPTKGPTRPRAAKAPTFLRTRDEPRREQRFEPKQGASVLLTVLGMSVGSLAVGMGVYAQWFRAAGSHAWALPLLGGGAAVFALLAFAGARPVGVVRVGDAGVAVEHEGGPIERLPWCDVRRVLLTPSAVIVQSAGSSITVSLAAHERAAARIVAEAGSRIGGRVEGKAPPGLPPLEEAVGEEVLLEPEQAAGQRCRASDKLIAFEQDARFCAKCGELYHKDTAPKRCLSCDAALA